MSTAQLAVEKVVLTCQRTVHKPAAEMTEDPLLAHQSDIISTVTKLLQQTGEVVSDCSPLLSSFLFVFVELIYDISNERGFSCCIHCFCSARDNAFIRTDK